MARIIGFAALNRAITQRPSFHPRHWFGWFVVLCIEICALCSATLAHRLSVPLGMLMHILLRRRRHIALCNIQLCFPEYSAKQHRELTQRHFQSLAITLFESAWAWSGRSLEKLNFHIRGAEHLSTHTNHAVLIISGHMSCMDLCSCYLAKQVKMAGVYRPMRSAVMEWYHTRGRLRFAQAMLSKNDFKAILQHLKGGGTLWYAPDQDFGHKRSCFVPFFGQPTATLKASLLLAQRSHAKVVTMLPRRVGIGHYELDIKPLEWDQVKHKQASDEAMQQFLSQINERIEATVRQAPEQYWWVHRRFKSRPAGYPSIY